MKRITISRILTILMWGLIGALLFLIVKIFIVEDYTRWGVLANMLSTIMLAIVPLYVLCRTRQDDKAKEEYRIEQENLEKLKILIDQNYSILDWESVKYAVIVMSIDMNQALNIFYALIRQIVAQGHRSDIRIPYLQDEATLSDYSRTFETCLKEYGRYINDMILACSILHKISINECTKSSVNEMIVSITKIFETSPLAGEYLFAKKGLIDKLIAIKDGDNYVAAVNNAIFDRVSDLSSIQVMQGNLAGVGKALIRNKEEELSKFKNERP